MSRFDEALRHLGSGRPAVLIDEDHGEICSVVVAADSVTPEGLIALEAEGCGDPVLWLGAGEPFTFAAADGAQRISRRVAPNGVLERARESEAAIDALRLSGGRAAAFLMPVALPGGLLAEDGAASAFAAAQDLPLFSIQDVIAARLSRERIIEFAASARLPSLYAEAPLEVRAFRSLLDGGEHLAMVHGPLGREPLVRLHSECLTGDALGSLRCDCGDQLRESLRLMSKHPDGGVVIYLRGQEGRGIGLVNKIRAYALQDSGRDTVEANVDLGFPADLRSYGVAVQILNMLGVARLKLLSNNPDKQRALERYGIEVGERLSLRIPTNPYNAVYIDTKRNKMGHDFLAPADGTLALPV